MGEHHFVVEPPECGLVLDFHHLHGGVSFLCSSPLYHFGTPWLMPGYVDEADLKAAITEVQRDLFGADRIYPDMKKKIDTKVAMRNIPDGYLIDLKVTPLI